jgi:hypothetical protein
LPVYVVLREADNETRYFGLAKVERQESMHKLEAYNKSQALAIAQMCFGDDHRTTKQIRDW